MSASKPMVGAKVYHLMAGSGDIAPYVLTPGDPDRVPRIAKYWDNARQVAVHREYVTYTGTYKGAPISAVSTGIGGPAAAIAIEELLTLGANTFIRVGTTGALQEWIKVGDVIINTGAVRLDGASNAYAMPEYPAVASYDVVLALITAAEQLGVRYHVGLTASTADFYVGQGRPSFNDYLPPWSRDLVNTLSSMNVLNFEMEAATIYTIANVHGARAGGIMAAIANRKTNEFIPDAGVEDAIRVANEAVRILHEWDTIKSELKLRYLTMDVIKRWIKQ
ncbi:uridine phosphorylase [Vulcanisaeta sp. EB80]|uniref:uridine phosphorylase n=1 Tax=Vulcanisaeta sp. EB80 TaxID=1650660 RepID=UPI0009BCA649|nr:uridine phosphorylase [Vulcanisaeta sp. EB80]PLC68647.1 uridine phosphorylase [Vulcanisaeta sp. EB80]